MQLIWIVCSFIAEGSVLQLPSFCPFPLLWTIYFPLRYILEKHCQDCSHSIQLPFESMTLKPSEDPLTPPWFLDIKPAHSHIPAPHTTLTSLLVFFRLGASNPLSFSSSFCSSQKNIHVVSQTVLPALCI